MGVVWGQALLEYTMFLAMTMFITYTAASFLAVSLQARYEAALAPLILALDGPLAK